MNLRDFARRIRSGFREYKVKSSSNKVTKEDIKNALKEIGIKEGDVLFENEWPLLPINSEPARRIYIKLSYALYGQERGPNNR